MEGSRHAAPGVTNQNRECWPQLSSRCVCGHAATDEPMVNRRTHHAHTEVPIDEARTQEAHDQEVDQGHRQRPKPAKSAGRCGSILKALVNPQRSQILGKNPKLHGKLLRWCRAPQGGNIGVQNGDDKRCTLTVQE